ncbi:MAG: 4Fe-4S binding protein [Akkermansia sp.]
MPDKPSKNTRAKKNMRQFPVRHFHGLRLLRVLVSLVVLLGFLLALTDFRQAIPDPIGHFLASLQFIPALQSSLEGVVSSSLIILVCLLVGTLIFGRVYCSFLCPLGIFQDILIWISTKIRGKNFKGFRYSKPVKAIRWIMLGIVTLSLIGGLGSLLITWIDPYSQFARMINMFLRPALAELNNALVGVSDTFFYVPTLWAPVGWFLIPILLLLACVWYFALRHGRLYCNTLCPVGALLGVLSRFSAFKLRFDQSACIKCGACMKSCRSQCINLRDGEIDYSRCVNCFDCASVCSERGIHYQYSWGKKKALPQPTVPPPCSCKTKETPQSSDSIMGMLPSANRRAFLGTTLLGAATSIISCTEQKSKSKTSSASKQAPSPHAISPAGSQSVARFLDFCTACHLCLEACPTKCLRPAYMEYGIKGILKPHLMFDDAGAFCNFDCTACADVCPAGAILPISLAEKKKTRIAKAKFHRRQCIATKDKTDCGACSEHCPTKALDMVALEQPQWDNDSCMQCSDCITICPVKAISWITKPTNNQLGVLSIDYKKCIGCGKCAKHCEGSALIMKPSQWDIRVPKLNTDYCIGCGACESACPVKAVTVSAIPIHEPAKVLVQKQAEDPNAGKDFAF